MDEFKKWLTSVCFQKPTPEALDLAKDAWKAALKSKTEPVPEVPCSIGLCGQDVTAKQINSACLSYRHDFGLMTIDEKNSLQFQAIEWLRAWQKEFGLR